jgi:hypothetical protein
MLSIYVILPAALVPEVYSASNRNDLSESKARPMREADSPTDIFELIVWTT